MRYLIGSIKYMEGLMLMPLDGRSDGIALARMPCVAPPGSAEKIAILCMRWQHGLPLHVDGDCVDRHPGTQLSDWQLSQGIRYGKLAEQALTATAIQVDSWD